MIEDSDDEGSEDLGKGLLREIVEDLAPYEG